MDSKKFLIFVIVILIIGTIIFLSSFFSKKAIVKRKLRKAKCKKIRDFIHGETGKIVGRVEFVDEPLISPLSGRTCALYYVLIEQKVSSGKSSHWQTIIEEEISCKFVIRDEYHFAYIQKDNLKSYLVQDRAYSSGFRDDAEEVLEKYLHDHGQVSVGFLGLNKTLRYKEGILEEGEELAVFGKGFWQDASQVNLPETFDRVLVFASTEDQPVYLSDDPDTCTKDTSNPSYQ